MRIVSISLLIMIGAIAFNAACPEISSAHSGGHPVSTLKEPEVVAVALKYTKRLVENGKIEKSWAEVEEGTGEIKQFGKRHEWVVTLKNSRAKNPSKGTPYFFFSLKGKYIATHFTGK